MSPSRTLPFLVLLALGAVHCGAGDDGASAAAPPPEADITKKGGAESKPPPADGTPPATGCNASSIVDAIAACIDGGGAPRACLAKARGADLDACDYDADGLHDALEDALLRSYAPVFAYNEGDGSHTAGDSEPVYPTNAAHYVSHSTLYWRVDGDDSTKKIVDAKPTLDGLRAATFSGQHADSPALGAGPNFWLCLNQENGQYPADALVGSADASRALAGGIDVFAVAHPTGKDPNGKYAVLEYMLFYPYNKFTLDDHEGDFEGGAVFVDLDTGKVVAFYTDRHATSDTALLVPLDGSGALPAKDPSKEAPHYDVCSDTSDASIGGARFWDFAGAKHHPVIFPAAGGHASYGYPGATKIQGLGCIEATMIRDVHNGKGPKLVPHEGAYYTDWGNAKLPVANGVRFVNLGEREHLRATWSAFAGQWGCTLSSIPKSYPGPWDNQRLCRHWLTNDWGSAPPFARSTATSCVD